MATVHSVFGLRLLCSRALPHLATEPRAEGETVEIELGSVPFQLPWTPGKGWDPLLESCHLDPSGEPMLRIWRRSEGGLYRFFYSDGTEFFVDSKGRKVWAAWTESSTLEDTTTYLLGNILGFVLRLRGLMTLHASAVVIDDWAVALAGAPGAGKSTTAAAFAQQGYPILSDDVTALRSAGDDYLVQASRPLLCLWPDSAEMLYGSAMELPRLCAGWEKRYLDLEQHGYRTERTARPLATVYLLDGKPVTSAEPMVSELDSRDAFIELVANSYALILDRQMQIQEFDWFVRLSPRISVLRIHKPKAGMTPAALSDYIADDFRRLRVPARHLTHSDLSQGGCTAFPLMAG